MPTSDLPADRRRNIIVAGASSGGFEALTEMVGGLPKQLAATLFIVQHTAPHSINYLPKILARHTDLHAKCPADGEYFEAGTIYVAPADRHLLIDQQQVFLSRGPRENRVRPAVDPLFRSAALSFGPRVVGVVLSGSLDDGAAGLASVKKAGGVAVVQDPDDAITEGMPRSALEHVAVDHVVAARRLGPLLAELAQTEAPPRELAPLDESERRTLAREVAVVMNQTGNIDTAEALGELAPMSCPDCGGPLWELDGSVPRFRCHTGHAFTARHLIAGLEEAEEQSLWVALRVMEERMRMLNRLAEKDARSGLRQSHQAFAARADEAATHVARLRSMLGTRESGRLEEES